MFYQSRPCFTNPVQSMFYHMPCECVFNTYLKAQQCWLDEQTYGQKSLFWTHLEWQKKLWAVSIDWLLTECHGPGLDFKESFWVRAGRACAKRLTSEKFCIVLELNWRWTDWRLQVLQILNFAELAYLFLPLVTVFRAESHEITTYPLAIENGRKELRKTLWKLLV